MIIASRCAPTRDYAVAMTWYLKAAEQGHAAAQCNLGVLFGLGQGVAQDYAEAMNWYRKAAEQGDADAQNNIGFMYNEAHGVSRDYVQAYMWLKLAAIKDNKVAKRDLAVTEAKLTKDQIAEAEGLAREWMEKHCK